MLTTWQSYHGSADAVEFDQAPCIRFTPQASGHSRHHTPDYWVPPIRVAGWVRIAEDRGDGPYDGIHLHVGHLGNDRNYVASLVRRDGQAVISREYGWRGYDDMDRVTEGPEFLEHRVYLVRVDWWEDRIVAVVADWTSTKTLEGEIPLEAGTGPYTGTHRPRIPAGAVGIRGDGLVLQAGLAVRSLPIGQKP